jgi:hypothetical protein
MSMASVRVVEVIPGKPYIGIEVPNSTREMVRLIELLETPAFKDPRFTQWQWVKIFQVILSLLIWVKHRICWLQEQQVQVNQCGKLDDFIDVIKIYA